MQIYSKASKAITSYYVHTCHNYSDVDVIIFSLNYSQVCVLCMHSLPPTLEE